MSGTSAQQQSLKGEVSGAFLLGLANSFYNLNLLPQGGIGLHANNIDPAQWYPYSDLIDLLNDINRITPTSENIFFRAGINFLRIWYEQGPMSKT